MSLLRTSALDLVLLATALGPGVGAAAAAGDEVLAWNVTALEVAAAGGQNNIVVSRTLAMVHLAVHDALNGIRRRYEPYVHHGEAAPDADPAAAIAAAAGDVLVSLIPRHGSPAQQAQAAAVLRRAHEAARDRGVGTGQAAAAAMIALRERDGAFAPARHAPGGAPGQWRPHPNPVPANPPVPDPAAAVGNAPALEPQWGQVAPFTLLSPAQFRLDRPPALTGEPYARATTTR